MFCEEEAFVLDLKHTQIHRKRILLRTANLLQQSYSQFYIQLVYKPHLRTRILLFRPFGHAARAVMKMSSKLNYPTFEVFFSYFHEQKSSEIKLIFVLCTVKEKAAQ